MADFERYEMLHRVVLVWCEQSGALKGASREEFRAFRNVTTGEFQAAQITDPVPLALDDLAGILAPADATLYAQLSTALADLAHVRAVNQQLLERVDSLMPQLDALRALNQQLREQLGGLTPRAEAQAPALINLQLAPSGTGAVTLAPSGG